MKTESSLNKNDVKEFNDLKYKRKYLLTKYELSFYKDLKSIADKYDLHILSKIRMADIVEPQYTADKSAWYSSFGKIKSKHVDFALTNPDNLYIVLLIELDDNSHKNGNAHIRDEFIDMAYESARIPVLHVPNSVGLEEQIIKKLNIEKKVLNIDKKHEELYQTGICQNTCNTNKEV